MTSFACTRRDSHGCAPTWLLSIWTVALMNAACGASSNPADRTASGGEQPGGPSAIARAVLQAAAISGIALDATEEEREPDDPAEPFSAQLSSFDADVSDAPTDHAVGTVRVELDVAEGRRLPVQLWYPAVESARAAAQAGRPVLDFEPPGRERSILERLTRTAGSLYTQRTMHAADAPEVLEQAEPFPLVLISHCNDCTRYTYFETAEQLAAKGFVVAAPDHVNNTLYDYVEGTSVGVELDNFLETRRQDMFTLTDILLNPSAVVVPRGLRGKIDPDRIGMAGHSFGALTTAYASTRDPRIRAIAALAMIISFGDNLPLLGAELAKRVPATRLSKPAFLLAATEDVIEIGGLNALIRQNYLDYPSEAWLATLRDAGHYSVTNICGIDPLYTNGCGSGLRVTRFLQPFDYLDIDTATALTAALVTTFFELQLKGTSRSTLEGIAAGAPGVLRVEHRAH